MEQITPLFISKDRDLIDLHPPTPAQLSQVRLMSNLGVRHFVIATFFDVPVKDLFSVVGVQVEAGPGDVKKAILANLQSFALSKRHPSAAIFWVKTFCKDAVTAPNDEPQPIGFYVYNNDGEPNYPI